jgi:caffeoyl-CoA O-methyltransferase
MRSAQYSADPSPTPGALVIPIVAPAIEDYARAHTTPLHPAYDRLRARTLAEAQRPQMQVGLLEGRLLQLFAALVGARRAVEVGTFTGYSAMAIAEGMPEGGHLLTCDIDPVHTAMAREAWAEVPWGNRIELRLGPAADTLRQLPGPIDFAFIDGDKENYSLYWDLVVERLRPGGLVVVDNVLWSGRVLDPQSAEDRAIVAFGERARTDERVDSVLLTVRDGVMVGRRR